MDLDFEEKGQLVDALLGCVSMSDQSTRNTIVNALDKMKNHIQRSNIARVDVINMVTICLTHSDGVTHLLKVVRFYEGKSIPMQKVKQVWSRITLSVIVKKIGLTEDELKRLYKATLPAGFLACGEEKLWPILEHLWDIPLQPDKTRPILLFVERLARHTDDQNVANELRTWTDQIAPFLGLQQNDIKQMRAQIMDPKVVPVPQQPSYLFVEVIPEEGQRNRKTPKLFRVEISLWKQENDIRIWYNQPTWHSLEQLAGLIEEVMAPHTDRPQTLEFFLPHELMACEVDQWVMKQNVLLETKFGIEYEVVVRSRDRFIKLSKQFLKPWQAKWEQFHKLQKPDTKCLLWIHDRGEYTLRTLYHKLRSKDKTCVGLTFIPIASPHKPDIFKVILQAGIPVALWSRLCHETSSNPRNIRAKIENIFLNKKLSDLPRLVLEERQRADEQNDQTDLGNQLTLFWDDPNRVPLKFDPRLQAP